MPDRNNSDAAIHKKPIGLTPNGQESRFKNPRSRLEKTRVNENLYLQIPNHARDNCRDAICILKNITRLPA